MRRRSLALLVFFTGTAMLLLEVTAMRLLAPYFGNSIYVLSSVLAVVLGFLSLGYWRGGILAERRSPRRLLFGATAGAGVGGLLIAILMAVVMPFLGFRLPFTWGPLVASVLLFSVPNFFFGMITPAAVRLHPLGTSAPGRASGELLAISTVGSIVGSLLGGFSLLPLIGLRWTVIGTSLILLSVGVLGLGTNRARRTRTTSLMTSALVLGALLLPWTWFLETTLIHEETTPYQQVTIVDVPEPDAPDQTTRYLIADHALMSGEDRATGAPMFDYVRAILTLSTQLSSPRRIAVLGAGAFTLPRILHERFPDATIDAVDIDPALERLAKQFFRFRPDTRLRVHVTDGRRFLREEHAPYDLIILDMYQSVFVPPHVITEEFFRLLSERLTPRGVAVMNIIGLHPDMGPSLPVAIAETARTALPRTTLLMVDRREDVQNFLLLASREPHPIHDLPADTVGARVPLAEDSGLPAFRDDRVDTMRYEAAFARFSRSL